MKFTFLGTGTSQGVPVIGCDCAVCSSADPRDRRLRASLLVESDTTTLVIDTGPDFRSQMLRSGNRRLDGILFTHPHKDHTAGLDDIRPFYFKSKAAVNLYGLRSTLDQIRIEFGYMFHEEKYPGVAEVNLNFLEPEGAYQVGDIRFEPILCKHAKMDVLGYRFGDFAYITDANLIPDSSLARLSGLKYLVVNALRKHPHPSHFTLQQAMELSLSLGAERTWFTHISHLMGLHGTVQNELPPGMEIAWDGLSWEC